MKKLFAPVFWMIDSCLYYFSQEKYWKDQRSIHKGLAWRDRSKG